MAKYYSIMTNVGLAATANAAVLGKKVNLTTFAVGDGSGAFYSPVPTMTALKGQKWSGPISGYDVSTESPNLISVTGLIPSDVGGWTIREIGVFDDQHRLIAIANYPDTEKISRDDGVSTEIQVGIELLLSNASSVTISVDPTMILATKAEVNAVQDNLNDFKKEALTGGKLGATPLTVTANTLIIPASDSTHDGYMAKEQAEKLAQTVPNTRKINGNALTGDVTLTSGDVGAVPTSRTVNGHALSSNVSLTAADVGAPTLSSHSSLVSQLTSTQASVAQLQTNLNGSWKTLVTETKPSSLSSNTIYYIVNDSGCLAQLVKFGGKDINFMSFYVDDIDYLAVCLVHEEYSYVLMGTSSTPPTYIQTGNGSLTGLTFSGMGSSNLHVGTIKQTGTVNGHSYDGLEHVLGITFELVTKTGVHIPIEKQRYNYNGWMDDLYKFINGITSFIISGSVNTGAAYSWYINLFLTNNQANAATKSVEITKVSYGAGTRTEFGCSPQQSSGSTISLTESFSCSINGKNIPCKVEDHISH